MCSLKSERDADSKAAQKLLHIKEDWRMAQKTRDGNNVTGRSRSKRHSNLIEFSVSTADVSKLRNKMWIAKNRIQWQGIDLILLQGKNSQDPWRIPKSKNYSSEK